MSTKKFFFENKVLLDTIKEAVDIVQTTLGPLGRNVVIKRSIHSRPIITKDGVTVLKDIQYKESEKNAAIEIIKEAAQKTADIAGDGTTTASILLRAILEKSEKYSKVSNNILLKNGILKGIADAKKHVKDISRELNSDDIKKVASVSANSTEIGNIIFDVIDSVGTDAVITVEEGSNSTTKHEIVEGMRIDGRGYLSPYFVNNNTKYITELEKVRLLLYDGNISTMDALVPILEQISQSTNNSILVIANSVEGDALSGLVVNKMRGSLKCAAIKAPSFGSGRFENMQDIATLTGGTVISPTKGASLEDAELDDLGFADKVIIHKGHTDIIGGDGDLDKIEERVKILNEMQDKTESAHEREKIHERIAKLISGVAVIKVGGESEVEIKELRDRIEDAVYATKAAIDEGIVPGGSYSFIYAHSKMKDVYKVSDFENEGEAFGYKLVIDSLLEPFRILSTNSGYDDYQRILNDILQKDKIFNFKTLEYEDKYTGNVIDPVKVIQTILSKVGSIASAIITTEKMIIVDENEIKEDQMPM